MTFPAKFKCSLIAVLVMSVFSLLDTTTVWASPDIIVKAQNRRLSVKASDVSFRDVLGEVANKTGIHVLVLDGVADRKVSIDISDVPYFGINTLLERMGIRNYGIAFDRQSGEMYVFVVNAGTDLIELARGKTLIRYADFGNPALVTKVKGKEIVTENNDKKGYSVSYIKDELLLKFHLGITQKEIDQVLQKYNLVAMESGALSKVGFIKVTVPDGREVRQVQGTLAREYKLKSPEPNYIQRSLAVTDPLYESQWNVKDTRFDAVYDKLKSKNLVTVAVVDSGVQGEHPDLKGKILAGYDFVNGRDDTADDNGHGTFVAGIVAASANDIGIKGLYDYARILPVKVIDNNGAGTYEDAAKGIIYAADNGAKVINLSIGGYGYSSLLQDAVAYAQSKGCIIVAAGGNDGIKMPVYPAGYPDVIGVAALEDNSTIWAASNQGRHIAVAAPGSHIISTTNNGDYAIASGTSTAAPEVSALASMLLSERPSLSASTISRLISQSSRDLGDPEQDAIFGNGAVDAVRALEYEVKPFHDVAVRKLYVDQSTLEKSKPLHLVALVQNSGTYTSETVDVVLSQVKSDKNVELVRNQNVLVTQTEPIVFQLPASALDLTDITFSVQIVAVADENSNNNQKSYRLIGKEEGNLVVLHKYETPVHQWIALQATKVWNPNLQEFNDNIGTWDDALLGGKLNKGGYDIGKGILIGSAEEDMDTSNNNFIAGGDGFSPGDYCHYAVDSGPFCFHFWNPDYPQNGVYNDGLSLLGDHTSAYNRASSLFRNYVITPYLAGDKGRSYYYLGRVAHLITDMTVPAHVHEDSHSPVNDDSYEEYFTQNYANYGIYNGSNYNNLYYDYKSLPVSINAKIDMTNFFRLFWYTAQKTQFFASDDNNGNKYYVPEKYDTNMLTIDYWSPTQVINDKYQLEDIQGNPNTPNLRKVADALMPHAMKAVAGLYRLFWHETHGKVTVAALGSSGQNLSGATYQLVGPKNSTHSSTRLLTADGNSAVFNDLDLGSYDLTISHAGYASNKSECVVVPMTENSNKTIPKSLTILPPSTGTLTVATTPINGGIYIDDVYKGNSSWTETVPANKNYKVSFGSVNGYVTPQSQTKYVSAGGSVPVTGTYTILPAQQGTLHVTTTPVNGEIFVNGDSKGISPLDIPLAAGTYTISFGAVPGYSTPSSQSGKQVLSQQITNVSATYAALPRPVVSGYIRTSTGNGIQNVTLTFSNGGGSATTDSNGSYSNDVPYGWGGMVTPTLEYYKFDGPKSYSSITSNKTNQNFTGSELPAIINNVNISPLVGSRADRGKAYTITWASQNNVGTSVKIELYRSGSPDPSNPTIVSGTPNDGTYSWKIPANLEESSSYSIRVSSLTNSKCTPGTSGTFTIAPGPEDWSGYYYWDFDTNGAEGWTGRNATISTTTPIFNNQYLMVDPVPSLDNTKSGVVSPPNLTSVNTDDFTALQVIASVRNTFVSELEAFFKIGGQWLGPKKLSHVAGTKAPDKVCVYKGNIGLSGNIEQVRIDFVHGSNSVDDTIAIDKIEFIRWTDATVPVVSIGYPANAASLTVNMPVSLGFYASDDTVVDHIVVSESYNGGVTFSPIAGCAWLPASTTSCSWTPTSLSSNARVLVEAYDSTGNKGFDFRWVTVQSSAPPCSAPATPTAYDPGILTESNYVTFYWKSINDATSYVVRESTSTSFTGAPEFTTSNNNYTFTDKPNGTYYYQVKARNACGESAWSNIIDLEVRVNSAPYMPSNPAPANGIAEVSRNTTLTWSGGDSEGQTDYVVELGTDPSNMTIVQGYNSSNAFNTSFTPILALEPATVYYWRIRSKDYHGLITMGPIWSFTTTYDYPDLEATSLQIEGPVANGSAVNATLTITNKGTFAGGGKVRFFYSSSPTGEENEFLYGIVQVGDLEPGQSVTVSKQLTLSNLKAGTSYLVAKIDTAIYYNEPNQTNNKTAYSINYSDTSGPTISYFALRFSTTGVYRTGSNVRFVYVVADDIGVSGVDLYYSTDNGNTWLQVANKVPASSYDWAIPANTPLVNIFKVKAVAWDASGNSTTSILGPFTIVDGSTPVINVTSPAAGEVWDTGTTHDIKWNISTPNGVARVQLYYEYGNTEFLTSSNSNMTTYKWSIPNFSGYVTNSARIRVTVTDSNNNEASAYSPYFIMRDASQPPTPPWSIPEKITTVPTVTTPYTTYGFKSPIMSTDGSGNLHMAYIYEEDTILPERVLTYKLFYVKKTGSNWESPVLLKTLSTKLDGGSLSGLSQFNNLQMTLDNNNLPHFAWSDGDGNLSETNYAYYNGTSLSDTVNISSNNYYGTLTWSNLSYPPEGQPSGPLRLAVIGNDIYAAGFDSYLRFYKFSTTLNSWSRLTDFNSGFMGVSDGDIKALNGMLYATDSYGNFQMYNPSSNTWTQRGNLLSAGQGIRLVPLNGKMYAIGGDDSPTSLQEYDPGINGWVNKASLPASSRWSAVVPYHNKLMVIGGYADGTSTYKVMEFDPTTNSWFQKNDVPVSSSHPSGTVLNDKIYFGGGGLFTLQLFDSNTNKWTSIQNFSTKLGSGDMVSANGSLYVVDNSIFKKAVVSGYTNAIPTKSYSPKIKIDSNSVAHILWVDGQYDIGVDGQAWNNRGGTRTIFYNKYDILTKTLSTMENVGPLSQMGDLIVDNSNTLHMVTDYFSPTQNREIIEYRKNTGSGWTAPITALEGASNGYGFISLALDPSGDLNLSTLGYSNTGPSLVFNKTSSGTWQQPENVRSETPTYSNSIIYVGSNGLPTILYNDNGKIKFVQRTQQGQWGSDIVGNLASQYVEYSFASAIDKSNNRLYLGYPSSYSGHSEIFVNSADLNADFVLPIVLLSYPQKGNIISSGAPCLITWTATDNTAVSSISLKYTTDGGNSFNTIASSLANTGSYQWNVPNIRSDNVEIFIVAVDSSGNQATAKSEAFSIADKTGPSLNFTAPLGGEVWDSGTEYSITWQASDPSGVTSINIYYSPDGVTWLTEASGIGNTGSYRWNVPRSAASTYRIKISATDTNNNSATAISNQFSVRIVNTPPVVPYAPTPTHGAGLKTTSSSLTWDCNDADGDSLTYDVYFGTAVSPPLVTSSQSAQTYQPTLTSNTTYYWKVVANDGKSTTSSPIWSFSTGDNTIATPTNLTAHHSTSSVQLSWTDNSDNEDGFSIERKIGLNGMYAVISKPDMLLQNRTTGAITIGYLAGETLIGSAVSNLTNPADPSWKIAGAADFNNDGNKDILLQDELTGSLQLFYMNNHTQIGGATPSPAAPDNSDWKVKTLLDFNNDGHPDILLVNQITGETLVWFMDGVVMVSSSPLSTSLGDLNWHPVGGGDFNDDGKQDLVIQNKISGDIAIWYLDGTTLLSSDQVSSPGIDVHGWRMAGVGDMKAAGKPDIILQEEASGKLMLFFMNGSTVNAVGYPQSPNSGESDWKLAGLADFNHDGIISSNATGYTDTALSGHTEYYYRVRAFAGSATSQYSNEAVASTQNSLPLQPVALTPADNQLQVAATGSELKWRGGDPDGDTVTYDIYFGTDPNPPLITSGQSGTMYNLPQLAFGSVYYWKILAKDSFSATSESPVWSFVSQPENTPEAPSDLSLSVLGTGHIQLSWSDNSDNELGFAVERKDGDTGIFKEVATATVTSYDDSSLLPDVTSFYRVKAFNSSGDSIYSNVVGIIFQGVDDQPPITSISLPTGNYSSNQAVTLTCDDGTGSGCNATYFTLDGTEPTISSSVYNGSIPITANTTIRYFSIDNAGNVEPEKMHSYFLQCNMNIVQSGMGNGSIIDDLGAFSCNGSCATPLRYGTVVSMSAIPDEYSFFSGWSGDCPSSNGKCDLTVNTDMVINATFGINKEKSVLIDLDTMRYYSAISTAYLASSSPVVIKSWGIDFTENLLLNNNVSVTLDGGYSANYTSKNGYTSINGTITIGSGVLTVDNVVIR